MVFFRFVTAWCLLASKTRAEPVIIFSLYFMIVNDSGMIVALAISVPFSFSVSCFLGLRFAIAISMPNLWHDYCKYASLMPSLWHDSCKQAISVPNNVLVLA